MNAGGAETFLMKIFRKVNHDEFHFDFCVSSREPGFYDEEIKGYGSRIFFIHPKTESFRKFKKDLTTIIKKEKYDAVYRCGATGFMAIDLWIAKKCGVKTRVFRSTNAGTTENKFKQFLNVIFRHLLTSKCNVKMAPSMLAAEYTFGKRVAHKHVYIINNGIDVAKYKYSPSASSSCRTELGLIDRRVFLHVGRFVQQKNHAFLINIFEKYLKYDSNATLILIGEGPLKNKIKEIIKNKGLEKNVLIMPVIKEIEKYYSVADVLLLPSLFEGMPNVVVEAQCSGLPCIVSDKVTREANILNLVSYCPLDNQKSWVNQMKQTTRPKHSEEYSELMVKAGYDINDTSKTFINAIFKK